MDIFRIATVRDVDAILAITKNAGHGLTTIPKSKSDVRAYVDETARFLTNDQTANRILFVIERDGQVQGISGIIPVLGKDRPFYSFKRSANTRHSKSLSLSVTHEMLQLSTEFDGYTELASIYLAPEAQGKGLGRLLSLGRLCFIHRHRGLFNDGLMADIRGWVDVNGKSPFWDGLTSKFITMSFDEADSMSNVDGGFLNDLMPSLPIMLNTLPPEVMACSGRAHDKSRGALKLLLDAGFERTDFCDVFDGGPSIRASFENTIIARTGQTYRDVQTYNRSKPSLHFRGQGDDFMATMGPINNDMADIFSACKLNGTSDASQSEHWVAAAYSDQHSQEFNLLHQRKMRNG